MAFNFFMRTSLSRRRSFRRCRTCRRGADASSGAACDSGAAVFSELCRRRDALCCGRRTDTGNVSGKTFQHRDDFLCRRLQHHDDAGCGFGIRRQMMIVQVILEGLGLGILLILVCAVGIRKGAVGIDMHQKSDTYTTTIARESLSN